MLVFLSDPSLGMIKKYLWGHKRACKWHKSFRGGCHNIPMLTWFMNALTPINTRWAEISYSLVHPLNKDIRVDSFGDSGILPQTYIMKNLNKFKLYIASCSPKHTTNTY